MSAPASDFYPLQIGNAWSYEYSADVRFYNADNGALLDHDTYYGVGDTSLERTEQINGVDYVIERAVYATPGSPDRTTWVRLRQDEDGLYRANLSDLVPPDSASATAPGEIVRLRYPLAVGAQWTVYSGPPLVTATVESLDTLEIASERFAAYRVRIDRSDQRPNDRQHMWYSRCGRIRIETHSELIAVDGGTGDRVRIVTEETQQALDVRLVDARDCGASQALALTQNE